jgi:hypothetical protein
MRFTSRIFWFGWLIFLPIGVLCQNVQITSVTPSPLCAGGAATIAYTTIGSFNPGNVFTFEISNSSGSFVGATIIGTVTSSTSGSAVVSLPGSLVFGTGYRIRAVSSSPPIIGVPNSTNLTVVRPPSAPVITADGPVSFCAGGSVRLRVSPQGGVNYQWRLNGSTAVGGNHDTLLATLPGSYTVELSNSCGTVVSSNTILVSLLSPPPPEAIIIGGPTTFCAGQSVLLSVPSYTGVSYQWRRNGNPVGTNSPTYSATTAGTYSVELSNSCGTTPSITSVFVTVNSAPLTPNILGDTTVCLGETQIYTITPHVGSSYLWSVSGGVILSGQSTTSVSVLWNTSGMKSITAIESNSCGSALDNSSVMVSDTPSAVTISGPVTPCVLQSGVVYSVVPRVGATYSWTINNATIVGISGAGGSSITVNFGTSPASGVITVTETNPCGSFTSTLNTNLISNASLGTIAGTDSVCAGSFGIVYRIPVPAPPVGTFTWTVTNGLILGPNNLDSVIIHWNSATPDTGRVIFSHSTVCGVVRANKLVRIKPLAIPTVTAAGPTSFCAGGSVVLNTAPQPGVTYQWRKDGVTIPGSNSPSYTATSSGNYSVLLTGNCGTLGSANFITVTVAGPLIAPIITGLRDSICNGDSVLLTMLVSQPGATFIWFRNGDTIKVNSNFIYAKLPGLYTVEAKNGCGAVLSTVPFVVGIEPKPNPVTITASGSTNFCLGGSVNLSVPPQSNCSYRWKRNGVDFGIADVATQTVSDSGRYWVEVTNRCGTIRSDTQQVTVGRPPSLVNIVNTRPTAFCTGDSTILKISSQPGQTFVWKKNSVPVGTLDSLKVTTAGFYTVEVTNSCGTTVMPGVTVTVSSSSVPPAVAVTNLTSTEICRVSGSVLLQVPLLPDMSYQWRKNGMAVGTDNHRYYATEADTYWCELTNICGTTPTTNGIRVSYLADPKKPVITSSAVALCGSSTATLAVLPQAGVVYEWKRDGVIFGADTHTQVVSVAANYTVTVRNRCGVRVNSDTFRLKLHTPLSRPTIISSGDTAICKDSVVLLSTAPQADAIYRWKRNGANIGGDSSSLLVTQSGTYCLEMSNACGTVSSTNCLTILLIPNPPPPVITSSSSTEICAGDSVTLNVQGRRAIRLHWFLDGMLIDSSNQSRITVGRAGIYTVELTDSCFNTVSSRPITITQISPPVPPFIVADSDTNFCSGGGLTLSTGAVPNVIYQWKRNGVNVGTNSTSLLVRQPGNYTLELTNACGFSVSANSITCNVINGPSPVMIVPSGPTTTCSGDGVTLNVTPQAGVKYFWLKDGDTISPADTLPSYTATASGSYRVLVYNKCDTLVSMNTIRVTVNALPTPEVRGATVCAGQSAVLFAAGGSGTYRWYGSARATTPIATGEIYQTPLLYRTDTFYVQLVRDGCSSLRVPVVVTVKSKPLAPVIVAEGNTRFCEGGAVRLSTAYIAETQYRWLRDGQLYKEGSDTAILVTAAGRYQLQISNPCGTIGSENSITVAIFLPPIRPEIRQQGRSLVTPVVPGASYQWLDAGEIPIAGATDPVFNPPAIGRYYVLLTDANGCSARSLPYDYTTGILPALHAGMEVKLYPNPAIGGRFTLQLINVSDVISSIELLDNTGKVVYSYKPEDRYNYTYMLNSGLPDGVYRVLLKTEKAVFVAGSVVIH